MFIVNCVHNIHECIVTRATSAVQRSATPERVLSLLRDRANYRSLPLMSQTHHITTNYLDLDCLLRAHCTDLLIGLSGRWIHPIQQQGRRFPAGNSVRILSMWFFRVSSFLLVTTQQIHSLRASGVSPSHAAWILELAVRTFLRSSGTLWTVPLDKGFVVIFLYYRTAAGRGKRNDTLIRSV